LWILFSGASPLIRTTNPQRGLTTKSNIFISIHQIKLYFQRYDVNEETQPTCDCPNVRHVDERPETTVLSKENSNFLKPDVILEYPKKKKVLFEITESS
jgi:hypothetical protein